MEEYTRLPSEFSKPLGDSFGTKNAEAKRPEEFTRAVEIQPQQEEIFNVPDVLRKTVQAEKSGSEKTQAEKLSERREVRRSKWLLQIASAMLSAVLVTNSFGIDILGGSSSSENQSSYKQESQDISGGDSSYISSDISDTTETKNKPNMTLYLKQVADACSKIEAMETDENIADLLVLLSNEGLNNCVQGSEEWISLYDDSAKDTPDGISVLFSHADYNKEAKKYSQTDTGKQIYTTQIRYYNAQTGFGIRAYVYYCDFPCVYEDMMSIGTRCIVYAGPMELSDPEDLYNWDSTISDANYHSFSQPYYEIAVGDPDNPENIYYSGYVGFTCKYEAYNKYGSEKNGRWYW